ncbi:MAG: hypothetical protein IKO36_05650 [Bacteroidaceae bacterium]|nr:hypothetical protein [Bacteroidaceae bacterium]
MFKILLAPKATPNRNEKTVICSSDGDITSFTIDLENKKIRFNIEPNYNKNQIYSYEDLLEVLKQRWDIKKISYKCDNLINEFVEIDIPANYEVLTIIT